MQQPLPVRTLRDCAAIIRGHRHGRGLSQAELSRMAGIERKTLGELESAKAQPTLGLLLKVLEPLGLTLLIASAPSARKPSGRGVDLDEIIREHRRR